MLALDGATTLGKLGRAVHLCMMFDRMGIIGRRASIGLALVLAAATAAAGGCAGVEIRFGAANASYPIRDDAAERCERDRGAWRPQIAGGYCEFR